MCQTPCGAKNPARGPTTPNLRSAILNHGWSLRRRHMHRFAHMADVHLGAHREPPLQKLELQAFQAALSKAVELEVDFVLVCGDLFHVGIPDLGVVNAALRKMMEVRERGIRIYAIYGSHDYTPNGTSVIDVLNTAGVLTNISKRKTTEGKLELEVFQDEKTGAKLTGISARKIGLESKYYELLDRQSLESVEGFKVFAFHSGLTQFKPPQLSEMETVDVSLLPKGFDYYAGGHIHLRGEYTLEGYESIVYPGPLFTGYGRDLEDTAKGEERGFYLVEFDDRVRSKRFVPVWAFDGIFRAYDLEGRNALQATEAVRLDLQGLDVAGKVVVMRAYGELAGGKVSDVDFAGIKDSLSERGALHVYLNRNQLKSKESGRRALVGEEPALVERKLFAGEISRLNVSNDRLAGEKGVATAIELLRILRQPPKTNESKKDYGSRMVREGLQTLGEPREEKDA